MIIKENGEMKWIEFDLLKDEVNHGVFLRTPIFEDRNEFDQQKSAIEKLLQLKSIVIGKQVHGTHVAHIDVKPANLNLVDACDGFMTQERNLALLTWHADCQGVLFYDPIQKAVANVHCGWRGSVKGILPKTVEEMKTRFGTRAENLLVCISPSLGPDAAEFIHFRDELPKEFYPFQVKPTYFNFWEISRFQLMQAGVLKEHIECANICTRSNEDICFSYRRNKQCGFHYSYISLKN